MLSRLQKKPHHVKLFCGQADFISMAAQHCTVQVQRCISVSQFIDLGTLSAQQCVDTG